MHKSLMRERRRTYNRWVASETLEDYALRFTAHRARRFSNFRIANTALGAASFLALEAIGGLITLRFGFVNSLAAIILCCTLIFIMSIPIAYHAVKAGVDIDLLTRAAGFGYLGSTITSLTYATFTFVFFAIEAAIVASALEMTLGLPLGIGYLISALAIIPLVTHGMTFISRFQTVTQPIWIILQLLPFALLASEAIPAMREWTGYRGMGNTSEATFDVAGIGAASAIIFALSAQIGEQVDFLRFLRTPRDRASRLSWWAALLSAGPGWVIVGALKIVAGSFLAFFVLRSGISPSDAASPPIMYLTAFKATIASPEMALGLTGMLVVVCQAKINVTNSYAGSIAWSNFFSRLTRSHPGRVVWLVFEVALALLIMRSGVYEALAQILSLYSIVAVAWTATIFTDLSLNKILKFAPPGIEFRRGNLFDINPVGFGSMSLAVLFGILSYVGIFGRTAEELYIFVVLVVPLVAAPAIAALTNGKYYVVRTTVERSEGLDRMLCVVCENEFDKEDILDCPFHSGFICSLCCSLETRCRDACRPGANIGSQIALGTRRLLHPQVADLLNTRIARYLALLAAITLMIGLVLWLVYLQNIDPIAAVNMRLLAALERLFIVLFMISGVVVWLFVLAEESRARAEDEVSLHTSRLVQEIDAHRETYDKLQEAKEAAESANLAKSRYVVGLSHELRTPLSAILGYAQLLERQKGLPVYIQNAARTIKRSGDHLIDMIEGLLDISKIEASRLEIFRHNIGLSPFLAQIVEMFALQAEAKGIRFTFTAKTPLPDYVHTDDKRLRQILINLLSNAIKFTNEGAVNFGVSYRSQVATFEISDTGVGIPKEDVQRVFLPFERGEQSNLASPAPGTGLGLTITKLLTEVMGGELKLDSTVGSGTTVVVRLMLSSTDKPELAARPPQSVGGYYGAQKTILIADDDEVQRALMEDLLNPLGFVVRTASDGRACLSLLALHPADVVVLDIGLPDMSGWEVARRIRTGFPKPVAIVIVSADAGTKRADAEYAGLFDAYLIKPVNFDELFEKIAGVLELEWRSGSIDFDLEPNFSFERDELPTLKQLRDLYTIGETGFMGPITSFLADIGKEAPNTKRFCEYLRNLAHHHRIRDFLIVIDEARKNAEV